MDFAEKDRISLKEQGGWQNDNVRGSQIMTEYLGEQDKICDNRVVRRSQIIGEYLGGQDKVREGTSKYREDGRMWRDKVVGEVTSPLATSHQTTLQIPVHRKYKLQIQIHYSQVMIKCGIITPITCVCIEAGSECQLVDRMQLFHQCNPARLPLVHYSATLVGWNQYFRRAE